jgi:trans-2,3-dihydro-3-hydroxyanthranilate isomerase
VRHCYVLRVFTRGDQGGNRLGVVTDVSGLPDPVMQDIAADLGYSETVFVDWRSSGVPRARIFTPVRELPFAGHPLVGAAWVLNVLGPGGVGAITCTAGEATIEVNGDRVSIGAPIIDRPVREASLDLAGWVEPVEMFTVAMPLDYHLITVADPSVVESLSAPRLAGGVYVWAWDGDAIKARFFAPEMGITEDPATGSAAVALAAVLASQGHTTGDLVIRQGDEIGSPSTIHLSWNGPEANVGGTVVRDGTRELDV